MIIATHKHYVRLVEDPRRGHPLIWVGFYSEELREGRRYRVARVEFAQNVREAAEAFLPEFIDAYARISARVAAP